MKALIAKCNTVEMAVNHYLKSREPYTFISLENDCEPYPVEEVFTVLMQSIQQLKAEAETDRKARYRDEIHPHYSMLIAKRERMARDLKRKYQQLRQR